MRVRALLLVLLAAPAYGAGPLFRHQDKIVQQEFENTYQDIRSARGYVESGTYTPTLTNVLNLDASVAYECQYMRVGTVVTVSGVVELNPTLTATATSVGMSLPIASNIVVSEDCAGTAAAYAVSGMSAAIYGDNTNNRAELRFVATDINSNALFFTFTYQVL